MSIPPLPLDPVEVAEIERHLDMLALLPMDGTSSRLYGHARALLETVRALQASRAPASSPIAEVPRLGSISVQLLAALPANTILCSGDVFERLYAAIGGLDER
jgi:hypothetical protein